MYFQQIKEQIKEYRSVVAFDRIFSSRTRSILSPLLFLIPFGLVIFVIYKSNFWVLDNFQDLSFLKESFQKNSWLLGLALLFFIFWLLLKMARAYLFSIIFSRKNIDFELAKMLLSDSTPELEQDHTLTFLNSSYGQEVIKRLFLDKKSLSDYISNKKQNNFFRFSDNFEIKKNEIENEYIEPAINVVDFVSALYDNDKSFSSFLLKNNTKKGDLLEASSWIYRKYFDYRDKKRWWSKERLASSGQLGVALSYGQTFILDRNTRSIEGYQSIFSNNSYETYQVDIEKLEIALVKQNRSNVFLVSESNTVSKEILKAFSKRARAGKSTNKLQNARIRILPAVMFFENHGQDFQTAFIQLLNEAADAGNMILVIEDFFPFYESAKIKGIDVLSIMKGYFDTELSFIILSNKQVYESFLQTNAYLKNYFETVLAYHHSTEGLLFLTQNHILGLERVNDVYFSFKALRYLVEATFRFFSNKSAPETFLKLLKDLLIFSKMRNDGLIDVYDTKRFIESKTGIPQLVTDKKALLSLEDKMHERIIGQNDAINSIADAIRRSRTGLGDTRKPIASFLFVGPTGVGKTETAKVLLDTYFSGKHKLIRFDMSEYSTAEAVAELIGSTYTNKQGALSKVVNSNPHSLILFDELEKANREVHDLFLQILDEGQIIDAFGTKLNFKNSIIIATSNAGSDLMYQDEFNNLSEEVRRRTIVDYIIDNKIFRPEFLNRFDKVILFNKLNYEEMKQIVGLQLKYLVSKMRLESYEFIVTEELQEFLAQKGGVSNFGARETKRIIKEELESLISKAILEEKITTGDRFAIEVQNLGKDKFLEVKKIL